MTYLKQAKLGAPITAKQTAEILACVDELCAIGAGQNYTRNPNLCGTWRLVYTTEKEILFIVQNAGIVNTRADKIFQVLDLRDKRNHTVFNTISLMPKPEKWVEGMSPADVVFGAFYVVGSLRVQGPQRLKFSFDEAMLKLRDRSLWLPPFGRGWFDVVYMDELVRVTRDSRGDTSVFVRQGDVEENEFGGLSITSEIAMPLARLLGIEP
ncbi:hypothetical protein WJX81_000530 [Elliptochloris bilobata]|uniref:Plastid lipid-associated protein/fibrillin conserved domain-containing protein n=1 Tax=Elliptochloris bilobata TaxID=381761 RepID=A0AAW1R3Q9_9CHLO